MADKGFSLKVLIPTEDGVTISDKELEKTKYYLLYNISNRSYQLAGKTKCVDMFKGSFDVSIFKEFLIKENVDLLILFKKKRSEFKSEVAVSSEIDSILNFYIDEIDKKSAKNN